MPSKTAAAPPPAETAAPRPAVERVPWNPWWAVLFVIVAFYAAQFVSGVLVSFYPWLKHWSTGQATAWLNNSVAAQFVFVLVAESLIVAAIYLFLKRYGRRLAAIGLRRPRWRDFGYGLLTAPAYYVVYVAAVGIVGALVSGLNVNEQQQIGFTSVHGAVAEALTFVSLVILPPVAEEIMFRGFLYSSLRKALPKIWAAIGVSLLFAAAHLPEGGSAGPLYIAGLDTFILSLFLIYLREKTGGLWASMTLHATKNLVAFALLFVWHVH